MSEAFDVKFSGMKAPATDLPLIEVETADGHVLDLYNEHWLHSAVIRGDELVFGFVAADPTVMTRLRFLGVRGLRVSQPEDWAQGEAEQIEHLLVRGGGPWPRIVFKAGGLEYEFDCAEVCLGTEMTDWSNDVDSIDR